MKSIIKTILEKETGRVISGIPGYMNTSAEKVTNSSNFAKNENLTIKKGLPNTPCEDNMKEPQINNGGTQTGRTMKGIPQMPNV